MRDAPVWAGRDNIEEDPTKYDAKFGVAPKGWTDKDFVYSTIEHFIEHVLPS
jgi:hypothetical protein